MMKGLKGLRPTVALGALDNPSQVYSFAAGQVANILTLLGAGSVDSEISEAKQSAQNVLRQIHADLTIQMERLASNAEWGVFTIAFFGETNAGKSTLIEALRILLQERTKLEERAKFKSLQSRGVLTADCLLAAKYDVMNLEQQLLALEASATELQRSASERNVAINLRVDELRSATRQKKAAASLWARLYMLLRLTPEDREVAACLNQLREDSIAYSVASASVQQSVVAAEKQVQERKEELARIETLLETLSQVADGVIIGDGRPDFTRNVTQYDFTLGTNRFALLDVPGIEGRESQVIDSIRGAVSRAHAIFYVTDKAAPPQKGHGPTTGTLEKINAHLGAQTEVWTIFNKRITNPASLDGPLVSQGERDSLEVLDKTISAHLGEAYRGTIPVSARVAFLALAECLVPDSADDRSRAKFVGRLSADELLEKSNLCALHRMLGGEFVHGQELKIRRSNFNKADAAVGRAEESVRSLQSDAFGPLESELRKRGHDAKKQLHITFRALRSRLEAEIDGGIRDFKRSTRTSVYAAIAQNIDNEGFRDSLEAAISSGQTELGRVIPKGMDEALCRFQEEAAGILSRFDEQAKELEHAYGKLRLERNGESFSISVKIDNGLRLGNLATALTGVALLAWNPAGWFVIAIGTVAVLLSLTKALVGVFSSSYKRAQQTKSADENIDKIADAMHKALYASLNDTFPAIKQKVEELDDLLSGPANEIHAINHTLRISLAELGRLRSAIQSGVAS